MALLATSSSTPKVATAMPTMVYNVAGGIYNNSGTALYTAGYTTTPGDYVIALDGGINAGSNNLALTANNLYYVASTTDGAIANTVFNLVTTYPEQVINVATGFFSALAGDNGFTPGRYIKVGSTWQNEASSIAISKELGFNNLSAGVKVIRGQYDIVNLRITLMEDFVGVSKSAVSLTIGSAADNVAILPANMINFSELELGKFIEVRLSSEDITLEYPRTNAGPIMLTLALNGTGAFSVGKVNVSLDLVRV